MKRKTVVIFDMYEIEIVVQDAHNGNKPNFWIGYGGEIFEKNITSLKTALRKLANRIKEEHDGTMLWADVSYKELIIDRRAMSRAQKYLDED